MSNQENTQSRIERNKIQMTFHKRDYTNNICIERLKSTWVIKKVPVKMNEIPLYFFQIGRS